MLVHNACSYGNVRHTSFTLDMYMSPKIYSIWKNCLVIARHRYYIVASIPAHTWYRYKYLKAPQVEKFFLNSEIIICTLWVSMSTVTAPLNPGHACSCYINNCNSIGYLQTMLLGSSLHLPPPALVIPSPSDVLLVETVLEWPSGDWVGVTSTGVFYFMEGLLPLLAGLAIFSWLYLRLGLEKMLLHSHQYWATLQLMYWMAHWLSALDQAVVV